MKNRVTDIVLIVLLISAFPAFSSVESVERKVEKLLDYNLNQAWQDAEVSWERGAVWRIDEVRETDELSMDLRTNPRGSTIVNLTIKRANRVYRRIPLSVRVTVLMEVPVAAAKLERYETVSIEHLIWEKRDISQNSLRYPNKTDGITNGKWCLRRSVQKGQAVCWSMLDVKPLVARGDHIDLIARSGNVTITAPGISLEKAYDQDRILVENTLTGARLIGVVIGEKSVLVEGVASQIR
ncbi:flagellar basal body P-ring formation chaperone FlgA [bacterium]|nr:flagellar basal body P-ring formation chaperone FlgA [bacterium]